MSRFNETLQPLSKSKPSATCVRHNCCVLVQLHMLLINETFSLIVVEIDVSIITKLTIGFVMMEL